VHDQEGDNMGRRHQELGSSPRERHAADLFFADLMGTAAARRSAPQQRARSWGRGREDYESYESYGEAATTAPQVVEHPELGRGVRLPASVVMTPPSPPTALRAPTPAPTPATAKREDDGERVFPPDDERAPVTDTTAIAFRFVCCLDLIFTDPSDATQTMMFRGTGTLISNRHVLTVAHNLSMEYPGTTTRVTATRVFAAPGRNDRTLPFGEARSRTLRVAPGYLPGPNREFDFGLVTLETDIGATTHAVLGGAQLGFWSHARLGGSTRIRPLDVAFLRGDGGRPINIDGYPVDKCRDQPPRGPSTTACTGHVPGNPRLVDWGSTQWRAFGRIGDASPTAHPRIMTYQLDTERGQSGAPVWLRWEQYRNLVGIHGGTYPFDVAPALATANRAVRITDDVLTRVREWMRADGVTPTF
jgi:V8-like Glu-specific endopeptidase